jgi:Mycothiol maleylpyruvate isomerase N-terminal domain
MTVDFARHCAEIVTQTTLLTGHVEDADLTVRVPTCPGWNVSQLLCHIDGGHRWAAEIVTGLGVTGDAQLVDFWLECVGFG